MADNVHITFTSEHEKVLQGLAKTNAKLEKQIGNLKKLNREGRGATKSIKGIGAAAFAGAAGFVSMSRAIGAVNSALQRQAQIRKGAAGRIEEQERTLKQLVQVSNTQEDLNNHLANTARIRAAGPGITQGQAQALQFQGVSLGFTPDEIVQIAGFKKFASDLGPVIEGIAGLGAAFGKQALGGTPRTRVNALLAAAQLSKVDIETISGEALTAAQPVKGLGGTAAETLAAVSVATVGLKSAEVAATAVARLADVLKGQRQFKGKGLAESLEILAGLSERRRADVIGKNIRAERGAGVLLQNLDAFRSTLAEINRAVAAPPGTGRAAVAMRLAETTAPLADLIGAQRAREERKAGEEKRFGPAQLDRNAIFDILSDVTEPGAIVQATQDFDKFLANLFGQDPLTVAQAQRGLRLFRPEDQEAQEEFTRRVRELGVELGLVTTKLRPLGEAAGAFTPNPEAPE